MTQPDTHDTDDSTSIEVDCPHKEVIGSHTVTLDKPIIDKSIGFDPLCGKGYRVQAGPPVRITKVT
jgi:hypothetical protein